MPRGVSSTQPTRSNARSQPQDADISRSQPDPAREQQDADTSQLVANAVKVLLNLSVNKHPIKKADLVKNALAGNGRILPKIMPQILNELKEVYGYNLVEADRNKTYLLVSHMPSASVMDLTEDFRQKYTLLYLVLGYIFMKNGNVPEQGLWEFLAKLNINDDGEEHPFFGDVRQLITDTFVRQAYLTRTKQVLEGTTDERFVYGWGVRANAELSKKDILESICKLMGKPSVVYVKQHMAAYGGEDDEDDDASQVDATQN